MQCDANGALAELFIITCNSVPRGGYVFNL